MPVLELVKFRWWCGCVPHAPTLFRLPSKPRTFGAFLSGRIRAKGKFGCGSWFPSTPFPWEFFQGVPSKGGWRRPCDASIFPVPSPNSPPQFQHAVGGWDIWGEEARWRQVRGTSARPITHHLILATPINTPIPTGTTLVVIQDLQVGVGAWGVEPSLPQPHPTVVKVPPSPGMRAVR